MTKTDLTKPHEITYTDAVPGLSCGQQSKDRVDGACGRKAKWTIFWRHLHRGKIKRARRDRCGEHGREFFAKHKVQLHG